MNTLFPSTECLSYGKNNRVRLGTDSFLCIRTFNIYEQSEKIMLEQRTRTQPYSLKAGHSVHIFLHQRTQLIMPTKCTLSISTNIKWTSPTYYGTCVPHSERTQCQSVSVRQRLSGTHTRHITNAGTQLTSNCDIYCWKESKLYCHTKRAVNGQTQHLSFLLYIYIFIYLFIFPGDKIKKNKT